MWERSVFCATPGNVPVTQSAPARVQRLHRAFDPRSIPPSITRLFVPVAWGTQATVPDAGWLDRARARFPDGLYAWAWCDGKNVEEEARVHAECAQGFDAFSANAEEPYDAHGDQSHAKWGMLQRYLEALDWDGPLCLTTTPLFGNDMTAWQTRGALYQPQAFPLETGVGVTQAVQHSQAWGWPLELIRPLVQSYPTNGERVDPDELDAECATLGIGGIPYTIEQCLDDAGQQWLSAAEPTIARPQPEGAAPPIPVPPPTAPAWSTRGYPGGPMVKVKGFPRPMYPPDAAKKGKTPSKDGPDVVAYKRTVSRAGRWLWQKFDDTYSDNFAHGKDDLANSGIAGIQKQQKIDQTGWIGEYTFNTLRSIRIPEGLPHAGEPAMDQTAVNLINDAYEQFKLGAGDPRQKALDHLEKRVGYTENPANSNCDTRSDGIRTSQDHTAGGDTWLRNEPWCGCWCYYALETAGVQHIDSHLASVAQIEDYARNGSKCYRGYTTDRSKVKKGDLVIIGGYGVHVETVRQVNGDGSCNTYGGNTSPDNNGSQSNGGGAYKRTRYPSEIRGFALVRYPGE